MEYRRVGWLNLTHDTSFVRQLFLLQMDDLIGNVNDNHIPRNDTGGCSSIAIKNQQTVRYTFIFIALFTERSPTLRQSRNEKVKGL